MLGGGGKTVDSLLQKPLIPLFCFSHCGLLNGQFRLYVFLQNEAFGNVNSYSYGLFAWLALRCLYGNGFDKISSFYEGTV